MFQIEFTQQALDDLEWFKTQEQNRIVEAIESLLRHEPATQTRNRKQLRDNLTARWELRVGNIRVFYNVEEVVRIVSIKAIGAKRGYQLFFQGAEGEL